MLGFKKISITSLLLITTLLCFGLTPILGAQPEKWAKGRILVQKNKGASSAQLEKALKKHGGKAHKKLRALDIHVVELPSTANEKAVARALSRDSSVKFAEVDALLPPGEVIPNDPQFASAWHLPKIGMPEAWDYSMGAGVVVAVLDTGVDPDHPDLANLVQGWNMYDNNSDWSDVYGHGTQVSGVIAATGNNALGVASIAWHASIMPVRISRPDGYAYFSTIASGLTWAADRGADVANISYAASGSSSVQSAAQYFRNRGGLTCVSAGNTGSQDYSSPNPYLISVSATTSSDVKASWSSWGSYVDISAPGLGIWTTKNGGSYGAVSGTSFSSPATAAVIALIKAVNSSLSPAQVEDILFSTTVDLGDVGFDYYYGDGRVDAAAAVLAAYGDPGDPPDDPVVDTEAPSVSIVSPTGGTVSGTVSIVVNATDEYGVVQVECFANGPSVGSDISQPWAVSWNTNQSADGPVSLYCSARDEAGNVGNSNSVSVTVDNVPVVIEDDVIPPVVAITSPGDGTTVDGLVKVRVSASDDTALAIVDLFIDTSKVVSTNEGSFSYSWNTRKASVGTHSITAVAKDTSGNVKTHEITITKEGATNTKPPKKK